MNVAEAVISGVVALVVGCVQATMGLIMKSYDNRIRNLEDFRDEIPNIYSRRDDAQAQFELIVSSLRRIEDKLDKKADKNG